MKKLMFWTLALGLLGWQGCKRCDDPSNPECRNYDPCYDQTEVSADFEMREVLYSSNATGIWDVKVTTGKLAHRRLLRLIGLDSGEVSHQWIIGQEPAPRTGQTQAVNFWYTRGPIQITHIVTGSPRSACFPDDDGIDTVVKTIEVLDYDENLPIIGTYRGYLEQDPDQVFDVEVLYNPDWDWIEVINLPEGCPGVLEVRSGANGVIVGTNRVDYDQCWGISRGIGQLFTSSVGDTLMIPFEYEDPDSLALRPSVFIDRETTFIGIRQ